MTIFSKISEINTLPGTLEGWKLEHPDWKITGWIGTAQKPKLLDSKEIGNLNTIVVHARGRLFHENILDKINDGRIYTKYLTGQIEADFLDDNELNDIATSDRQRIQEDDPRYLALITYMKSTLGKIESEWSKLRKSYEPKEVKKNSPVLQEWIDSLPRNYQKSADELIAKLSSLEIQNEEDRKTVLKHGVLSFERMRLRNKDTQDLVDSIGHTDKLIQLFADRDSMEASLYGDIIKSRLDTIKNFLDLVDNNEKEKVLQQYLFDHLWLLDPSWERVENTEIMESRLLESDIKINDLTEKEKLSRVDIAYRTTAGKHLIIELKKADRALDMYELSKQGMTYVDKLKKILRATENKENVDIEVIFVIGKPVECDVDRKKSLLSAISPGSRIVHYDSLIHSAQKSYQEYLDENKKLDKLDRIIDKI
ncbi:hypothetical protein [Suttonella ornithocola]|uniref:DUF4263 domain-containing protein n=1 Tax=Suttonella ornithocola TaxID=279832 RepID=A0A380MX11_9GAMM|nr:hypothetical protein [Suttonella ornithocola]SUO96714.1 Uncharacterised protein [Suttonella ornithocola]